MDESINLRADGNRREINYINGNVFANVSQPRRNLRVVWSRERKKEDRVWPVTRSPAGEDALPQIIRRYEDIRVSVPAMVYGAWWIPTKA